MKRLFTSLTIKERAIALDPVIAFQDRPGLAVHEAFYQRIVPVLRPVEAVTRCRYETLSLNPLGWGSQKKSYPRNPRNVSFPRWEPNSAEIFEYFHNTRQNVFTHWTHLMLLIHLQKEGGHGLLVTSDVRATFCFMQGVEQEVFLIRAFWNSGPRLWYLRAWSFQERMDRGWSNQNWVLLPEAS